MSSRYSSKPSSCSDNTFIPTSFVNILQSSPAPTLAPNASAWGHPFDFPHHQCPPVVARPHSHPKRERVGAPFRFPLPPVSPIVAHPHTRPKCEHVWGFVRFPSLPTPLHVVGRIFRSLCALAGWPLACKHVPSPVVGSPPRRDHWTNQARAWSSVLAGATRSCAWPLPCTGPCLYPATQLGRFSVGQGHCLTISPSPASPM
jgi:hypothetical protein